MIRKTINYFLTIVLLIAILASVSLAGGSNLLFGMIEGGDQSKAGITFKIWDTKDPTVVGTGEVNYYDAALGGTFADPTKTNIANIYPNWSDGDTVIIKMEKGSGSSYVSATSSMTLKANASSQHFPAIKSLTAGGIVIIDKFEGTKAAGASDPTSPSDSVKLYYTMSGTGTSADKPTIERHKPTSAQEGSYSMGVQFTALTTTDDNKKFRGYGGQYDKTIDLSSSDIISFYLKGDGLDSTVKFQLSDADGSNYSSAAIKISKSDDKWKKYQVSVSSISTKITAGTTDKLDLTKIKEYQIVFPGTAASASKKNAILIDNITATAVSTSDVLIVNVQPNPARAGQVVTITGKNLGKDGKLEFEGSGVKSYIEKASKNTPIKSWVADKITFTVPVTLNGKMKLTVEKTDKKRSNAVDFTVSGSSTNPTYNYPNPFNPNGGESTIIVFSPGAETSASIYIIDITGQIVGKVAWTSATAAQVTWNGKDFNGNTLGDGVYLYRVAAGSKLLGRGKILIINR